MKHYAEKPIELPGSPFWNVFKRFGRDESVAMFVNVIGTAIVSLFSASVVLLSVAGPIVEKIGFFPAHIWEAWKIYKTSSNKKPLRYYIWRAVKGGSVSLFEDILIHDPIYILLMMLGFFVYPETPAWLLASVSFIVAVFVVAFLEVGITELRYMFFKSKAKKYGFDLEKYYEARFFIDAKTDPSKVIEIIVKEFGLEHQQLLQYYDVYYNAKLPSYSGRQAKIRYRKRTNPNSLVELKNLPAGHFYTAQIVYTRAMESSSDTLEQYRFFPIAKEKLYYMYFPSTDETAKQLPDKRANNFLNSICGEELNTIKFVRYVAFNDELLVSTDRVRGNKNYYLLEVKTRKNIKALLRAMRFIMLELPVVQTTYGKLEICNQGEENE